MALFPAFADVSNRNPSNENSSKDLDWLSNQSFRPHDALVLHQKALEQTTSEGQEVSQDGSLGPEWKDDVRSKRKKKKEKKKKRKKKRGSSGEDSGGSGYESDTVYPSDLLKQAKDAERQEDQTLSQGSFMWLDDLPAPSDRPFCIDKKANAGNWQYKSLYRGDIARYRRKGSSCLGLDSKTQAVSWAETKPTNAKRVLRTAERYFCSVSRQQLSAAGRPELPGSRGSGPSLAAVRFIPVPPVLEEEGSMRTTMGPTWVNPLGVYDSSTSLWLQGKGLPESEGQKEESSSVTVGTGGGGGSLLAAKVEDFNRRLREDPADTPTWLEFVRFQDELMAAASPFSRSEGEAEGRRKSLRMTLEKKVSILDRALESNPSCVDLKLARLRLGRELWDAATLIREWRQMVFLRPNDPWLWREYLLFIQGQFSTLTVPKVSAIYGKGLSTLASVLDGALVSHPVLPGTEEAMLGLFLQQCHFLRQAGHSEKAIALFQAQLDFNFFKPDTVKDMHTKQQVEFFEPFWDSGEPRVGEKGARGWRAWMHQQERGGWVVPGEPDDDDDDEEDEGSEVKDKTWPKWRIWLDVETSREASHWLPWRPDKAKGQSEEDCEDPDRQVLFDDVGPSLIRLMQPELRVQLLRSFLHFLGMPADGCLRGPSWNILLDDLSLLQEAPDTDRPLTSGLLPTGVSPVGHTTMLGAARRTVGLCKQGEEFIQLAVQQLWPLLSGPEKSQLSLCLLQYEKLKVLRCIRSKAKKQVRSQGKRSKRLAKRILKEECNRSDLALWREFGHLEWLLGNLEEARKVLDTALALGLVRGFQDPALCDLCLLYAQLEVEQGAGPAAGTASPALHLLSSLAEGGTYSHFSGQVPPVSVLKARRTYEQALAAGGGVGLVGCFALFQYLTVGVEAADQVYREAVERLEAAEEPHPRQDSLCQAASELEALCMSRASLLRYAMSSSICPMGRLRDTLTSSISRFPGNQYLWQLYLLAESRYHGAGRSRRFTRGVTQRSPGIVPWLFTIRAEQSLKMLVESVQKSDLYGDVQATLPESGLKHRIRALFESAAASEHGARCPLLWKMYLHFLVSEREMERGRGIFYKALQYVPWVKSLYMDAVLLFPDNVQEFLDLMQEKELRLRVPMEEVDILLED
uniref:NRDE-2, necessary for RNA interference, domain containing n=1 Tax=Paramormyrops kingsleyae TaxID=1676925 RepID=A0A3B3SAA3_9TELE|nr:protein NRDE2 homolog [Paramormyrops kingsleyae]